MLPIILVPGLICSAEIFAAQAVALWPYGPVTIASTLEGATMAEIAGAILREAPPRFALAGISMGGYLSFEIMRQAPERVVKLALLDTSARPDTPEATTMRRERVARARAGEYEAVIRESMPTVVHPDNVGRADILATNLRMARDVGVEGFARQQDAIIARPDSRPGLAAIKVPTLVLVGEADKLTPPEVAQEIVAGIAGCRLVTVAGAGHSTPLEQPEAVSAALVAWIKA